MPARHKTEWEAIARLFEDSPTAAYQFARALQYAQVPLDDEQAALLDDLIDTLFPYTDFYDACRHLYWLAVRGRLHPNHDPLFICKQADPAWPQVRVKPRTLNEQLMRKKNTKLTSGP